MSGVGEVALYLGTVTIVVTFLIRLKRHIENGSSLIPKMSLSSLVFRTRRRVNRALAKRG